MNMSVFGFEWKSTFNTNTYNCVEWKRICIIQV